MDTIEIILYYYNICVRFVYERDIKTISQLNQKQSLVIGTLVPDP